MSYKDGNEIDTIITRVKRTKIKRKLHGTRRVYFPNSLHVSGHNNDVRILE